MEHLKALIKEAVTHRGFSLIDILQPCVSFNKINTFEWYRQRVYRLSENYDPFDRAKAFEKSLEWGDSIPIGVVYKTSRPVFEEQIPVIKEKPLVEQKLAFEKIKSLIGKFY